MKYKLSDFFRPSLLLVKQPPYTYTAGLELQLQQPNRNSFGMEILNGKNWPGDDQIGTEVRPAL
jgi:hypothetical protein